MTIKKSFAAAAAAVCAVFVFLVVKNFFFNNPWTASECDKTERVSVASPDGARLAKHFSFVCGAGLTQHIWNAVVVVRRGQAPVRGDEVWTGDIYYRDKIDLSWQDSDRLRITLPNESLTHRQSTNRGGVMIEYKFDPDDPSARQEYLAKQNRR